MGRRTRRRAALFVLPSRWPGGFATPARPRSLLLFPAALLALIITASYGVSRTPADKPVAGNGSTPLSDCCSAHPGTSCDDSSCSTCVCLIDPVCCDVVWDDFCAEEANLECADSCPCETADCCLAHGDPGCDQVDCQSCVCALDPTCCAELWDDRCVEEARLECDSRCACDVIGEGDCCAPHASPGCEVSACEACVCGEDEFCCLEQWDSGCVEIASLPGDCRDACSCELSTCCFGRETPGCDEPSCEQCVCGVDEFCCLAVWDERCATIAMSPDECAPSCVCESSQATPTPTVAPSETPPETATGSPTATTPAQATPTTTAPSGTPSETVTSSPTATPSSQATPTTTAVPSETPSEVATSSPTATRSFTPTAEPSGTSTPTVSATVTIEPSPTASHTATPTPTFSATSTQTVTASPTPEPSPTASSTAPPCAGDCDGDRQVSLAELIRGVNVALGLAPLQSCTAVDVDGDGVVSIDEIVAAVARSLGGCG